MILRTLKSVVAYCIPDLGFTSKYMSARSLCSDVTMYLLCAVIISNIVKFIRHLQSNKIICYLHVQAEPIMKKCSSLMVTHGTYTLIPTHEAPCY